jgi:parallel beta-helix repeat protein
VRGRETLATLARNGWFTIDQTVSEIRIGGEGFLLDLRSGEGLGSLESSNRGEDTLTIRGAVLPTALCAVTVVLWVLTTPARGADGVIECGSVIAEDTTLTHDLSDCENGLIVAAPNVTLDLGGHLVLGRGAGEGVRVQAEGVVVHNGTVRAFGVGVAFADGSSGATVSHLNLESNGSGIRSPLFDGPEQVLIENNTVHANGVGVALYFARSSQVLGNRILNNQGHGIDAFRADGSLIEGNLVTGNGSDGVHLIENIAVVTDNTFSRNGGDGLEISEICGFLNHYRIGSNVASHNGSLGINVHSTPCPEPFDLLDAGGNAARRNGDPRECTFHVECAPNRGQAQQLASLTAPPARPD